MNSVHIHLILNHVPVIVVTLSAILLTWSIYNDKADYRKLAYIGFVVATFFALAAFASGEEAEEMVENLSWFSHDVIEDHEHAAETTRWLTLILGIGGIAGLVFYNQKPAKGFKLFL